MLKITLDTNILVSAFIAKGNPYRILELARQGIIQMDMSMEIFTEFITVINQEKFGFPKRLIEKIMSEVFDISNFVTPVAKLDIVVADPSDNKILECAITSDSDYIVSGDHHLLDLEEYAGTKIITPNEFIRLFSSLSKTS